MEPMPMAEWMMVLLYALLIGSAIGLVVGTAVAAYFVKRNLPTPKPIRFVDRWFGIKDPYDRSI